MLVHLLHFCYFFFIIENTILIHNSINANPLTIYFFFNENKHFKNINIMNFICSVRMVFFCVFFFCYPNPLEQMQLKPCRYIDKRC